MGKLLSVFVIIFCLIFTIHALADDNVITNKINDALVKQIKNVDIINILLTIIFLSFSDSIQSVID